MVFHRPPEMRVPASSRLPESPAVRDGRDLRNDSWEFRIANFELRISRPTNSKFAIRNSQSKNFCQLQRVIRNQDIRPRPLDGCRCFENYSFALDPTCASRGFDHGILTADLVSSEGHIKLITGSCNDIEISKGWFDHDNVRAFFDIELNFPQSFACIRRVHLITTPVAELWRRACGFAKRPVEARRIFGCVRHDRRIQETLGVQSAPDR